MATLQTTALRLIAHLLHLALQSQLTRYTISAVFGTSYINIYRSLIIPILFTTALTYFLRQHKNSRSSRRIHLATTAYSDVVFLLGHQVAFNTGQHLGPWYGAFTVDVIATFPIVVGTASSVARVFHASNLKFAKTAVSASSSSMRLFLIALAATRLLMIFENRVMSRVLPVFMYAVFPKSFSASSKVQLISVGSTFISAIASPPRLIALAVVGLLSAVQLSAPAQVATGPSANVLASTISTTGYLSVISLPSQGLRILRNDHSILGGNFVAPPPQISLPPGSTWKPEPIFAAFVMQEAARLITPPPIGANNQNNALIIGLGIGTSAGAMISHNISVDVVELDPMVVDYAVNYFDFPLDKARVTICDGRQFIRSMATAVQKFPEKAEEEELRVYDYIIHDVFTGGVVLPALFTKELWIDVKHIMAPDGILVVNFGGNLESSMARALIRTLVKEFKSDGGKCRAYRETAKQELETDFTNLVVFCRKTGGLNFRTPNPSDLLDSLVRYQTLPLKHEVELPVYLRESEELIPNSKELRIVRNDNLNTFAKEAAESAACHWRVMNQVVDWTVWCDA